MMLVTDEIKEEIKSNLEMEGGSSDGLIKIDSMQGYFFSLSERVNDEKYLCLSKISIDDREVFIYFLK